MGRQKRTHVELFPPAVQNQAARLSERLAPAIAKGDFVSEAATTWQHILVMIR
jgi:hypothetical protein